MSYYLILDGARLERHLEEGKSLNELHRSLYRGETDPAVEDAGPFLFSFPHAPEFKTWFLENGLHDYWGILVETPISFEEVYRHFRKFLMVRTEDGQQLYFRFYDPRVLRIFLPTCDAGQLREFFGPVTYYFCADDDPAFFLVYSLRYGQLHTERVSVEDALNNPAALTDPAPPAPPAPPAAYSPTPPTPPPGRPVIIIRRK